MTEQIERFEIHVSDLVLEDLADRLAATRFPDEIEDTGWEYGMPMGYLHDLVEYWRTEYDWRAHEAQLNELPHFRTRIDGQSIHFVHARSPHADAMPLLLVHGWPGSFVEFLDVIPKLTDPEKHGGRRGGCVPRRSRRRSPGYGFSEPDAHPRLGPAAHRPGVRRADAPARLRARTARRAATGARRSSTRIGAIDPQHCAAIHLNMPLAAPPTEKVPLSDADKADLAAIQQFRARGVGLRVRAGNEAADARRGAQRLPRRPARVDRGEVPHAGATATATRRTPSRAISCSPT